MPVSREVVEHVAHLAHVGLAPEEIEEYTKELSSVIDHVARLQQVDTADVSPTAHVVAMQNVMRDDEVTPSWPPAAVLANAPHRVDDLFEVQAILD
jgi:aspartyl-tRNA(Asn)/glutamyl-tRNA(Gln) amidotransferase subunit C